MPRSRVTVRRTLADYPPPTPQPTPCRLWQGVLRNGYGVRPDGQSMHRWVWEQINGPIPAGMEVMHLCDQPLCYRYDHLRLGTHAENVADMKAKGRAVGRPGEAHHKAQLTEPDIRAIRASTKSATELAREFGVHQTTISRIRLRQRWPHVD
jgi:hypothetical protein